MANFYFKKTYILIALFGIVVCSFAQNYDGPGGVGSDTDNRFWFDANSIDQTDGSAVSTWTNQGGNVSSFNQSTSNEQPLLNLLGPNNQSELNFDGTNDYFDLANNSDLNSGGPWNERSFVLVFTTGSEVSSRQVLYEEGGAIRGFNIYIEGGNLFFSGFNQPNDGIGSPWGTPAVEQISTSSSLTPSTSYILTVVYEQDGGDNTSGSLTGYLNNSEFDTNNNIGILYVHTGDINLAGNEDNLFPSGSGSDLYPFEGSISEYIIYNRAINNSERIIINNYLSSKYDISLTADDEYFQDTSLAGDYDFNVIGVRQNPSEPILNTSFGTGILRFQEAFMFGEAYMYIGSNTKDQTELLPSTGCTPTNNEIIPVNSVWRVSTFSDTSPIFLTNFGLDITNFNTNTATVPGEYKLIIDDNPSFSSPNTISGDDLSSGVVTFNNVFINDGDYISLEIAVDRPSTNTVAGLNLEQELRFHFEANSIDQADGTDVMNWENHGANALNAQTQTNSPSLIKEVANGQDFVQFDSASNESLEIPNNTDINQGGIPWEERSYSLVFQTGADVNTRQMLYEEGGPTRGVNIYLFNGDIYFGAFNNASDGAGSPWTFKSVLASVNPNTTYVLTNVFKGNSSSSGSIETFLNGDSVGVTSGVGLLYDHTANISIGQNGDGTVVEGNNTNSSNQFYNGLLGEFLFYNLALNQNQIDLLNNFLMAKYGVTPTANDIYAYDIPAEGNFDFNLVGVRDIAGNRLDNTTFSSGILKMSNPSSLTTGEHIVAASDFEDQTVLDGEDNDCTSSTNDTLNLNATWRVDVQGSPGSVDLEFTSRDLNIAPENISDIRLLIDDNPDFSSPDVFSPDDFCSNTLFQNVNFSDGDYFTLRRLNVQPILWDGTVYANGSGATNEPTTEDISRKFVVDGTVATLNADFGCGCLLVTSGSDITLDNLNAEIKGDINNQGSILTSTTEMLLTGERLQEISVNGFEVDRVVLDNVSGLNLNLTSGQNIELSSALKLMDGNFETNGQLIFKSTDTQTAIVESVESGASITGEVQVERRIPVSNRAFRYISSPVNTTGSIKDNLQEGVNNPDTSTNNDPNPGFGTHITGSQTGANGFDATSSGNASMYSWDISGQAWIPISDTDTKPLNVDESYALLIRGDRSTTLNSNTAVGPATTLRFNGTLETGTRAVSPTNLSGNIGDFNLIANPYQAQVDLTSLLDASTSDLNTNFAYVYDPTIGSRGGYATIDLNAGTVSGEDLVDATPAATDANEFLQPNQAFFIETTGASPSITYEENDKSTSPNTTTTFSTSETIPLVNIDLKRANNDILVDGIKLKFNDNYSDQVDSNDAAKAWNFDESITFFDNGSYLSINKRTEPQSNETIQLFMFNYIEQNYSLDITLDAINPETTVYLIDNYLDTQVELTPNTINTYDFNIDSNVPESSDGFRFSLEFDVETFSIDDNTFESNLRLYPNPIENNLFTISSQLLIGQNVNIDIVNLTGQLIYSDVVYNASQDIRIQPNQQLSTGIYIVKISTSDTEMSRKIIVK